MSTFEYTMADGQVFTDDREQVTLSDEIAFERHFNMPAAVTSLQATAYARWEIAAAQAKLDGQPEPEMPPEALARSEWISFFSWRRLRRKYPDKVAASYEAFSEAVVDWVLLKGDDEEEAVAADADSLEAELLAETGSGLDPTVQDRQPTPLRS